MLIHERARKCFEQLQYKLQYKIELKKIWPYTVD